MASYVDTIINELLRGNELPRSESRKKKNDDFPTGGMSYVTPFPTGAMSEAPVEQKRDDYNPNGFTWKDGLSRMRAHYIGEAGTRDSDTYKYDKDGKSYIWSGLMPEMPQEYEKAKEPEYTITEIPEAPSDEDTLIPQRPIIDWDKEAPVWNPTPEELGVSYAGGLPAYAIDPNQVRSATNAYAPDQSVPAAMDPQQYMSANGLLPREPLDLSGIQPEAGNNPIPTWARVGMGLADLLRISGTRGGLYPETAVEDPTAYVGATMDQVLKRQKQEQELEKAAKANDLARAKILSQAAMDETDPARKAEFGRAIKRLLPRETQGLDDITAAGMFTGDDKIALEREKQKGRLDLQVLKDLGAMDRLGVKGQQASDLEDQKHGNRMEELRAKYAELGTLETQKSALRFQENEQKHGYSMALQQLKNDGAMARQQLTASKSGKVRGQADAPTAEEMNRIGLRTAPEVLAELKQLNASAGRWARTSNPSEHNFAGRHLTGAGVDYGADYALGTTRTKNFTRYENLMKQLVQDQLRKIYGSQFTAEEGERFFRSMGLDPIADPEDRWELAMEAINNLRLKHGYDEIDPDTLEIIPNTAYKAPQSSNDGGFDITDSDGTTYKVMVK